MTDQQISRESNEMLLRLFVGAVGADYKTDYSPHLYPEFSAETVKLWSEIENRLHETVTLHFDRYGCEERIREEIRKQTDIVSGGPDYSTSYHVGIRSGLNLALQIIEENIGKLESETKEAEDETDLV